MAKRQLPASNIVEGKSVIKAIEFRANIPAIMSGIRTGGDGIRLTLDIPESDVQDAIALIALRNCPLIVTIKVDGSPVSTRVQRPEDTTLADGYYWSYLFKQGFLNDVDMQEALLSDSDGAHDALRKAFGVDHLSTSVAPAQFEQWIREKGLKESFITMSRNAQVYQLGKQGAEGS
jgi:hypothetical protein